MLTYINTEAEELSPLAAMVPRTILLRTVRCSTPSHPLEGTSEWFLSTPMEMERFMHGFRMSMIE